MRQCLVFFVPPSCHKTSRLWTLAQDIILEWEQRKKRRVGEGTPCKSRKTVTLTLSYVWIFCTFLLTGERCRCVWCTWPSRCGRLPLWISQDTRSCSSVVFLLSSNLSQVGSRSWMCQCRRSWRTSLRLSLAGARRQHGWTCMPARERLDMCSTGNRPWSWECLRQEEKWMLGYVHSGQPTVIFRVFFCECLDISTAGNRPWSRECLRQEKSECLDMCTPFNRPWSWECLQRECLDMRTIDNRPWSWDEKSECLNVCQVPFLFKTVTSVTSVTSVILMRIYCFRFMLNL